MGAGNRLARREQELDSGGKKLGKTKEDGRETKMAGSDYVLYKVRVCFNQYSLILQKSDLEEAIGPAKSPSDFLGPR